MTRRTWALFAAVSVLWGSSFLLIKIAVDEVSPTTLVFARTLLGALFLLPIAVSKRTLGGLRSLPGR